MSRTQMEPIHAMSYPRNADPHRHHNHHSHSHGVTKSKKTMLTGGGRAWREDEEAYLLQTRLQKMPYKHIAAHLNKTELACRLHFHQLSHGSTRRKRTASVSSGSSDSPIMPVSMPSPMQRSESRSLSPARYNGNYEICPRPDMQLPSIMNGGASSRLPSILPKPSSMNPPSHGYRGPGPEHYGPLPPVNLHRGSEPAHHHQAAPLRLDCSALAPPSASTHAPEHVDLSRLHSIYSSYRNSFWSAIATEYGPNSAPQALETAWKTGKCCGQHKSGPMTPDASPSSEDRVGHNGARTRIADILSADADVSRDRRW